MSFPGEGLFSSIARLGLRRPGLVLAVIAALTLAASLVALRLGVSTSRTGLVADDHPDQVRLHDFFERFGRPDAPTFLISGADPIARREVATRLQAALEQAPEFRGRVLGRLTPGSVAELLLLQDPTALLQLRQGLPAGLDPVALVEGGVVAWLDALATRLEDSLAGGSADEGSAADPNGSTSTKPTAAEMGEGLDDLAAAANAFDDYLAGENVMDRLSLGGDKTPPQGIDERGFLVTGTGDHHLVVVYPALTSDEGAELAPMVQELRRIRDDVMAHAPAGVVADLTGLPAITVDELEIVQQGLAISTVVATAGILLLCAVMFRSAFQTIAATLPLLPGVVVTLAAVQLSYGHLNLITSSFVAVLLGLGIDFSVHLISRFNEHLRAGRTQPEATYLALAQTGPGILVGGVITAVGFLAGLTTEFTAYGELGVITAIGLVAVMLATFFLLPPLLGAVAAKKPPAPPPEPVGMQHLPGLVRRGRVVLVVIALLTGGLGVWALGRIEFNPRYFGFLPERAESGRALVAVEYDSVASPIFANLSADSIEEARDMTTRLRALDTVAGVQTPSDLMAPLDAQAIAALRRGFDGLGDGPDLGKLAAQPLAPAALRKALLRVVDAIDEIGFAMKGSAMDSAPAIRAAAAFTQLRTRVEGLDDPGLARLQALHPLLADLLGPAWRTASRVAERGRLLPTELPPLFAHRFAAKDGSGQVALFVIPAGQFWEPAVAEAFAASLRTIDPDVSGLAMNHVAHGTMILRGFERAAGLAAGIILIILLADFRRLSDAVLALLPTALGWTWMLGMMDLLELRFDVANIVALPLVLGVGIAYGVHMLHRLREADGGPGRPSGGGVPGIDELIRGTGSAVATAALTTAVGFAALTVSDYGGMRSLGLVMVIGIAGCLVATLLVLPAVLVLLRRAR